MPLLYEIRRCSGLAEAVGVLARTIGDLCRAERVGVFLLDESKNQLLLSASWPSEEECREDSQKILKLTVTDDPLCYCLQTGKSCQASPADSASMQLLGCPARHCSAFPLIGGADISLGAVLVALAEPLTNSALEAVEILCSYGAMLFDSFMQKRRDSSLLKILRDDLASVEEHRENARSPVLARLIGESDGIRHVRELILKAAPTEASVLITGETGTGKELVADAIHELSKRRAGPLCKINCAAIPAQLLESELFGYKKGAFTGAVNDSMGLLRSANGGTLFLDEIGDMPPELQAKLLRFLQNQEVRPVGSMHSYPVSIRIIAATNNNLLEAMRKGGFRSDLYHRLAAFQIHIPSLRDRQEDILILASHYLRTLCAQYKRDSASLSPHSLLALSSYSFPGNVRELINLIESAIVSADVKNPALPIALPTGDQGKQSVWKVDLKAHMEKMEQSIIAHTLEYYNGNTSKAAGALGLPRSTLNSKLRKSPGEKMPAQGRST